ncbi:ATP-binding protein [Streptomyces sp. NPDC059176]|uniref:ATP-binding protein n=1 Tax=Streptomyces sp. NPDC059176 TaxID=3346758 RepID=UPI00368B35CC
MIISLFRKASATMAPSTVAGGERATLDEADALLVHELRQTAGQELARRGIDESVRFTVQLVVDELVTNSLQHQGSESLILGVLAESTGVRVVVKGGTPLPHAVWDVRPASTWAEHGRGLLLTAELTSARGLTPDRMGVWCLVPFANADRLGSAA